MLTAARQHVVRAIPFDADRLDRLMEEAGIDVLVATSKHNVQYLLGGHRAFFFDYMDAMGLSRYLPVFVYPKGAPGKAAYYGHRLEGFQKEVAPFWVAEAHTTSSGSVDVMQKAIDHIRKSGVKARRIGAELAFLPVDSGTALRNAFPDAEINEKVVEEWWTNHTVIEAELCGGSVGTFCHSLRLVSPDFRRKRSNSIA